MLSFYTTWLRAEDAHSASEIYTREKYHSDWIIVAVKGFFSVDTAYLW